MEGQVYHHRILPRPGNRVMLEVCYRKSRFLTFINDNALIQDSHLIYMCVNRQSTLTVSLNDAVNRNIYNQSTRLIYMLYNNRTKYSEKCSHYWLFYVLVGSLLHAGIGRHSRSNMLHSIPVYIVYIYEDMICLVLWQKNA